MNVKNKILALVMSFVICFGTVSNSFANDKERINNLQPLFVDGGIISAPMLATVSALAVGTGIIINNTDDIYDLGRIFYDYIDSKADLTWDFVKTSFAAGVVLVNDVVHVDNNFLDIVKGFFDSTFSKDSDIKYSNSGVPFGYENAIKFDTSSTDYIDIQLGEISITGKYVKTKNSFNYYDTVITYRDHVFTFPEFGLGNKFTYFWYNPQYGDIRFYANNPPRDEGYHGTFYFLRGIFSPSVVYFPYSGGYTWDNVESKKENESIALPVPGDLGQLVGQGSDSFWENTDGLVGGGSISLPGVGNPSIDVTDDVFVGNPSIDVPGTDSPAIPNDSIWSTIKDFVVSLVVPSDTFWTDTFNGFRDNFSKNFPMLDMSKFDSLAVGGKPFPNLYAYGSKIVDGDIINSIVDWLRPIIAGFIMICLMFFNYRKIYKLIRNTEPFGGIAQGTSDFRTGLSAPPVNNGLDSNPMGNLRDTLFDMRNEILRRENSK